MQPKLSAVEVVPEDSQRPLREGAPDIPHVTAMCCHNCVGKACPLFIILKQLRNLPNELLEFEKQGEAWFASSNKGYMTRETFVFWCIHFVNWLSYERTKMDPDLCDKRVLLITDGHLSRECPLAVNILDSHKVDLLILPSHCTHVLQMFDVVIAASMKAKFSKLFKKKLGDDNLVFRTKIAKLRFCVVFATISAWQSACTRENCVVAAAKTGTYPCGPDKPLESPYIRELTEKEEEIYQRRVEYAQRNFVCSSKQLNNPNVLLDLTNKISQRDDLKHLLFPLVVRNQRVPVSEIPNHVKLWHHNGSCLLSRFHPLLLNDRVVKY